MSAPLCEPNASALHENPGQAANWRSRFFTIWTGQAFSLLGSMLVQFALVWWLTESTGSATVLALATLVASLPQVAIGPLAGTLVDRWNRRAVMIVADSLIAAVSLLLAYLFAVHAGRVWHVLGALLIRSVAGAFHWFAMQASTSLMVPKEQLSRVSGLNQTLNGAMNILAPPLGALLLGVMPLHGILLIDLVTAAMAVGPLLWIAIPQPAAVSAAPSGKARTVWQDLRGGLDYVRGWPGLVGVMIIATVVNFLARPAFSLLPILVTKHFRGGAPQLGLLNSVWGIGVVAGGLFLSAWGGFRRMVLTCLTGLFGMGVGLLVLGLAPATALWLGLAGMMLAGFMQPIVDGPLFAAIQATVAAEMQGRVLSLLLSAAGASSLLSLLVAGPIADLVGVRAWYLAAGLACALMAIAASAVPAVMTIEEQGERLKQAQ
jgi:DHA3 family macrolide efflux protein-like MFS transporter